MQASRRPDSRAPISKRLGVEKTSFASNASGIRAVRLQITTGAQRQDAATNPGKAKGGNGHHVQNRLSSLIPDKARLAAGPIATSGLDRMRFLFTMSDIGTRTPHDRGWISSPTAPVSPHAERARQSALKAKLMLHRNLSSDCPGLPLSRRPAMVEPDGIEPTTSCLQSTRSPN